MKFPYIAYWAAGLLMMLFISERAPRPVTYSLLAILLLTALYNQQQQPRPDNRRRT